MKSSVTEGILWTDKKRTLFGLPLSFTRYTLTDDRLLVNTGLLNLSEEEVRLYRILDVELKMSLWQRIFGVGSIYIKSADKTANNFEIRSIKNPRQVKEQLSGLVEEERDKKRVMNREMMQIDDDDDDDSFDH